MLRLTVIIDAGILTLSARGKSVRGRWGYHGVMRIQEPRPKGLNFSVMLGFSANDAAVWPPARALSNWQSNGCVTQ